MSVKILNRGSKIYSSAPTNPIITDSILSDRGRVVKIGEDKDGNTIYKYWRTLSTKSDYNKKTLNTSIYTSDAQHVCHTIALNGSIKYSGTGELYPLNYSMPAGATYPVSIGTTTYQNASNKYGIFLETTGPDLNDCIITFEVIFVETKI